jgi:hypothetical protein
VRYHRCRGKVRHSSQRKAEAAARSLHARDQREGCHPALYDVYPCPTCLGWHVGTRNPHAHENRYAKE